MQSRSDLNWPNYGGNTKVDQIADQKWIEYAFSNGNERRIRTRSRSDPLRFDPVFACVNVARKLGYFSTTKKSFSGGAM